MASQVPTGVDSRIAIAGGPKPIPVFDPDFRLPIPRDSSYPLFVSLPRSGPHSDSRVVFWGVVFLIWYVSDSLSLLAGEVESVAGFAVVSALRRDFSCCWLIESGLCLEAVERGDSGVFVGEPSFSGFLAVSPLGYFVFGHIDLLDVFVCCSIICFALGASAAYRSPGCCLFLQVTGPRLLF